MDWGTYEGEEQLSQTLTQYIYIYAFSRRFYPIYSAFRLYIF